MGTARAEFNLIICLFQLAFKLGKDATIIVIELVKNTRLSHLKADFRHPKSLVEYFQVHLVRTILYRHTPCFSVLVGQEFFSLIALCDELLLDVDAY